MRLMLPLCPPRLMKLMPRPMKPTKAMSRRASEAYKPKLKRPKAKLQPKTMIRPKAKFLPEATPEAKL
jgi:hypothetical protein